MAPPASHTLPRATYRLQLRPEFGFDDVAAVAEYLAELGISHVYCSPYLQAAPGSAHGYDVVDPTRVSDDLGGAEAHARMCAALRQHGLGQIIDVVPNHMCVASSDNRWWWDVLKHGADSAYAGHFDIHWQDGDPTREGQVLLPILGEEVADAIRAGHVRLGQRGGDPVLLVYDRPLPLAPGTPTDDLDALLDRQHYRLAYWRTGARNLNYRRFFDINELAALRMHEPRVFDDTHRLVLQWLHEGTVDGVRVDHPDGLLDPQGYFERLRSEAPHAWIVAEKILEPGEQLCDAWPIDGTTGYDFLNLVGGLFVDGRAEAALTRLHDELTGASVPDPAALVRTMKRLVLDELLSADLDRLARRIGAQLAGDGDVREAVSNVIAALPVYRTYLRRGEAVRPEDEQYLAEAFDQAQRDCPQIEPAVFGQLRRLLAGSVDTPETWEVIESFQELTGPAMAKGLEDTVFYRYFRLVCLNEVGSDPSRFGVSVAEFHRACSEAHGRWPATMLASSTHDTKRGEDVRCRIAVLSQLPEAWERFVRDISARSHEHWGNAQRDPNTAYLIWQILVGAWPISTARLTEYLRKAIREAKLHTSWLDVNADYERGVLGFAARVLDDAHLTDRIGAFVAGIEEPARRIALAQLLIKLTAPGVPDVYQGTELWDGSLVDPDNRRPVDFDVRRRLLGELAGASPEQILAHSDVGLPKLFLLQRTLALRAAHPGWFGPDGDYQPLWPTGSGADSVVAFARAGRVVTVAPRLVPTDRQAWEDTRVTLPPGRFQSALHSSRPLQGEVALATLFERFPVALLYRERRGT